MLSLIQKSVSFYLVGSLLLVLLHDSLEGMLGGSGENSSVASAPSPTPSSEAAAASAL